jgi:hypothetical protein
VAYACNPRYSGGREVRIAFKANQSKKLARFLVNEQTRDVGTCL